MRLCFLCTGNICRSPMAALVFTEHLRRAGLESLVEVTSAGTGPWHVGDPADPRTASTLAEHGYPTEHVAAQINDEHLDTDLLIGMDAGHVRVARDMLTTRHGASAAEAEQRVRLLRSFDSSAAEGAEVPDPYYGGERGFEDVLEMIEAAMPGLVEWVRERVRPNEPGPAGTGVGAE